MSFVTEYTFELPRGYVDENGQIYKNGRMRLATALDEIEAFEHPQVKAQESFLPILLLSRVTTQLGPLSPVTPDTIIRLFAADIAYLQDLYLRLNSMNHVHVGAICPHCSHQFQLQVAPLEG